jgi:TonB family protein
VNVSARNFVVTTTINGNSRSRVWNSAMPLPIGFPFRWVLERTAQGVRVRYIAAPLDEVQDGAVHTISDEMIDQGRATVELTQGEQKDAARVTFEIRPATLLKPAYEASHGKRANDQIQVYASAGHWLLGSGALAENYVATAHGEKAFTIRQSGNDFHIELHQNGFGLEGADPKDVAEGPALRLTREQLMQITLSLGGLSWRFAAIQSIPLPAAGATTLEDPDSAGFKKAVRAAVIGLAAFITLSIFWPKPQENPEELIPPQFTKLVMKSASVPTGEVAENHSASKAAPKKAAQAAVVQAFRAKALQSAVSGLLKGGMTSLLAESNFAAGTASADAKRIFNSKSDSLKATATTAGMANTPKVKVASLGGEAGGTGVGYKKGQHAGVVGQGQSLVSLDDSGSNVEEGLTKDEVGEVIHKHLSEVRYCYESAMLRMPDLEGKLVVGFTIGAIGTVKTATVENSTLPDPRLDDCIVRRLSSWKFPHPKGGVDVAVSYPFIFKTLGR